jgi:DNA repair protein RecN (Recombination protein N)
VSAKARRDDTAAPGELIPQAKPSRGLMELRIRGVGVIDSAEWEWGPGLTVITGETGSGKTMVLTGLALVLGGASDAGLVRTGHATAVVEGRFHVDDPEVAAWVAEAGGDFDEDGSLVLTRSVAAAGRSRAHLGGRTVPAATLAQVGARLVAVHGQDDQHRLLRPSQQRAALDRFGGTEIEGVRDAYRRAFDELAAVLRQRDDVLGHAQERAREAAELRDSIDAIDRVAPVAGEEESLRAEAGRLAHVDEIVRWVASARELLSADDTSATSALASASAAVVRAAERDPSLEPLRERVERLSAESADVAADLVRYLDALDADPGRLDAVEGRRGALGDLRRRLERTGSWPDLAADPAAWREEAARRLDDLGDDTVLVAALDARVAELLAECARGAGELSLARAAAANTLAHAVTEELSALAMGSTRLVVDLRRRAEGSAEIDLDVDGIACGADRHGIDDIAFLLVTRDAPEGRPLAKSASGGERSRVMLALEVVFAGMDPVPTFVFDEVDAGVGGKAAIEVGHRLALLARTAQVIVVTHLAQVAAFADRHVVVRPGTVTAASISYADGSARVTELARMLGGQEDSATAAAHAEELLDLAATRLAAGRSRGGAAGR